MVKSLSFMRTAFVGLMLFAGIHVSDLYSQSTSKDEAVLVVTADGITQDDAIKTALRNALEQTYGAFVSSNTQIANDVLMSDEIVTITSGNVKSYKIISANEANGRWYVTVEAVVSVGKLLSYVGSKGGEATISGGTFMMNERLNNLNLRSKEIAAGHVILQMREILPYIFDYTIEVGEPEAISWKNVFPHLYGVEANVIVRTNKNASAIRSLYEQAEKLKPWPEEKIVKNSHLLSHLIYNYGCFMFKIVDDYGEYQLEPSETGSYNKSQFRLQFNKWNLPQNDMKVMDDYFINYFECKSCNYYKERDKVIPTTWYTSNPRMIITRRGGADNVKKVIQRDLVVGGDYQAGYGKAPDHMLAGYRMGDVDLTKCTNNSIVMKIPFIMSYTASEMSKLNSIRVEPRFLGNNETEKYTEMFRGCFRYVNKVSTSKSTNGLEHEAQLFADSFEKNAKGYSTEEKKEAKVYFLQMLRDKKYDENLIRMVDKLLSY